MRRSGIVGVATAAALTMLLAACGAPGSAGGGGDGDATESPSGDGPYNLELATDTDFAAGSTMAKLAEAGELTIGTKFDQPLFGLQGPDGTPVGFDVAIGALVASQLGIPFDKIKWTETISANRETFIQTDQVDLVVATYTINDDRKTKVDFAGPYFEAGQSIMVLEDNTDIKGPEDLKGQPVCSAEGSTPAKNIVDKYGAELKPAGAYSDCLEPLRQGSVVALTTDNVILSGFVDQNPGEFKLVGDTFTQEPYGIGLKLGDTDFRNWIDDVLEASYEDGTWARLFDETAGAVLDTPEPPAVDRY